MKLFRRNAKLVSAFLSILMLSIAVPFDSVLAAMIRTEDLLYSTRAKQARDDINSLFLREDVQNALMAQGIDPLEAKARIDSLSDTEVIRIADEIDKLPAGAAGKHEMGGNNFAIAYPVWVYLVSIAAVALIIVGIIVGIVYLVKTDGEDTEKK